MFYVYTKKHNLKNRSLLAIKKLIRKSTSKQELIKKKKISETNKIFFNKKNNTLFLLKNLIWNQYEKNIEKIYQRLIKLKHFFDVKSFKKYFKKIFFTIRKQRRDFLIACVGIKKALRRKRHKEHNKKKIILKHSKKIKTLRKKRIKKTFLTSLKIFPKDIRKKFLISFLLLKPKLTLNTQKTLKPKIIKKRKKKTNNYIMPIIKKKIKTLNTNINDVLIYRTKIYEQSLEQFLNISQNKIYDLQYNEVFFNNMIYPSLNKKNIKKIKKKLIREIKSLNTNSNYEHFMYRMSENYEKVKKAMKEEEKVKEAMKKEEKTEEVEKPIIEKSKQVPYIPRLVFYPFEGSRIRPYWIEMPKDYNKDRKHPITESEYNRYFNTWPHFKLNTGPKIKSKTKNKFKLHTKQKNKSKLLHENILQTK